MCFSLAINSGAVRMPPPVQQLEVGVIRGRQRKGPPFIKACFAFCGSAERSDGHGNTGHLLRPHFSPSSTDLGRSQAVGVPGSL